MAYEQVYALIGFWFDKGKGWNPYLMVGWLTGHEAKSYEDWILRL